MRLRLSALLLSAVAVLACSPRAARPPDPLVEAGVRAAKPGADARTLALGGFHAYLIAGKPEDAKARFDEAVAKDPADPYALAGQLVMARRAGHPERSLAAALQLLERAPQHPMASVAARLVLDLSATAVSFDDEILGRGRKALQGGGLSGDAAHLLRGAIANIEGQRGNLPEQSAMLAEMGTPSRFSLVGPFTALHVLDADTVTAPEKTGSLAGPLKGPFGELTPRELVFVDGRMTLEGEPDDGDSYVLAADFDVPQPATYTLRTVTQATHKVYLDGTLLVDRKTFATPASTVSAAGVGLPAGKHRLLVRMIKDDGAGSLTLSLMRADGKPAQLVFTAASGAAPRWSGVKKVDPARAYPGAEDLRRALVGEAGPVLSSFLAVRDGLGRDREGVKPLLAELERSGLAPIAIAGLRAELALVDRGIPTKVARGRATRDLETVMEGDKGDVQALITRANLALEDQRHLDAAAYLERARAAQQEPGYPVRMLEARVHSALGVAAQAEEAARVALQLQPGLCDALQLRYDLARRRDAVAAADQLLEEMVRCPGTLSRGAEHARVRGNLARAAELYARLVERDPSQINGNVALLDAYVALKRYDDAVKVLERALAVWPRSARLLRRLADVQDLAGRKQRALELRERSLLIDGSDLALRRSVERARTGKELLHDFAISGKEAIAAYERNSGSENTSTTTVLDAAAVQVYPDGSMVDRIHIIQKALDQAGVQEIAEVNLPPGAAVLALRTLKPDGRVLEPESIEGKDTISLPGVQIGDFVESEYLMAHDARGPAQPGFTASAFYFQLPRAPNHWSTYTVVAPKGTGMAVDAHNMKAEPPKVEGDQEVFAHAERRVEPFIPEPDSPPSADEVMPFVQVGAGTRGNEGVLAVYSDVHLDKAQRTYEVEQFAKQAAGGKTGLEAVKALHAAVMQRVSGRDSGLGISAAATLAQDRGSRLWLLKAALEAVGIPTRLAAVRTFSSNPASYLFPNEALLPYVCLRAEVPGAGEVWLDTFVRYGPFGELPETARDRDAWLFPEPGRPQLKVHTPKRAAADGKGEGKRVALELTLGEDGVLTGTSTETYVGFEAAQIAEALESMSPEQRNQGLQGALSSYFGGAELSDLELDLRRAVGAPVTIKYTFRAPRFARVEGDRLILGAITYPVQLGRRFVQLGQRRTPLFIGETEESFTTAKLKLPKGMTLKDPLDRPIRSAFGEYVRSEKQTGDTVAIEERYRLNMARIPPEQYEAFGAFAGDVDLIQSRDVVVAR